MYIMYMIRPGILLWRSFFIFSLQPSIRVLGALFPTNATLSSLKYRIEYDFHVDGQNFIECGSSELERIQMIFNLLDSLAILVALQRLVHPVIHCEELYKHEKQLGKFIITTHLTNNSNFHNTICSKAIRNKSLLTFCVV